LYEKGIYEPLYEKGTETHLYENGTNGRQGMLREFRGKTCMHIRLKYKSYHFGHNSLSAPFDPL
jgi:hypothetical protein